MTSLSLFKLLGATLLGAVLTAIGFLAKRRLTGAAAHERAAHYKSLADLRAQLEKSAVTVDDLRQFDQYLAGHPDKQAVALAVGDDSLDEPDSYWTQTMMNRRAAAEAALADAKLELTVVELEGFLNLGEVTQLHRSLDNWKDYRTTAVAIAADEFSGGTMAGLIRGLEFKSITEQKIAELAEQLASMKRNRTGAGG